MLRECMRMLFTACVCMAAVGFAHGGVIVKNTTKEISYSCADSSAAARFDTLKDAIAGANANDTLVLVERVLGVAGQVIQIDKSLSFDTGVCNGKAEDKEALVFEVQKGAVLNFANAKATRVLVRFVVKGGTLNLTGGDVYADGANPIIQTTGDDPSTVVVNGTRLNASFNATGDPTHTPVAVLLDGEGTFRMENGAQIKTYTYNGASQRIETNIFDKGIEVKRGVVSLDAAEITVGDSGLYCSPDAGKSVSLTNRNVSIVSSGCGVYALAGNAAERIDMMIADSTISAYLSGIKLNSSENPEPDGAAAHTLTLEGEVTVTTQSALDTIYAIEDVSDGKNWTVTVHGGAYGRQPKDPYEVIVTNRWVTEKDYIVSWPTETNFTVRLKAKTIEVTYDFNGVAKPQAIPYDLTTNGVDISSITPESLGVKNSDAIFEGWYDTAECIGNAITNVMATRTVYAKWNDCKMTFHRNTDEDDEEAESLGLVKWIENGKVDLEKAEIDNARFGWENPDKPVFVGWSYRQDGFGEVVKILDIPFASTNLYAMWAESNKVAYVNGEFYETLEKAIDAAGGTNVVVLLADILGEPELELADRSAIIDLNGRTLGAPTAEMDVTISGTNELYIINKGASNGVVYGTLFIGNDATVHLDGGTYISQEDEVVSAYGANYMFVAENATFKGSASVEDALSFASSDSSGYAMVSNSVVSCASEAGQVECGITLMGGTLWVDATSITALKYGIDVVSHADGMSWSNACAVVNGSSIAAYYGIRAEYSDILVEDSTILSEPTGGMKSPVAILLEAGGSIPPSLTLRGTNTVTGGTLTYGSFGEGGFVKFDEQWKTNISITGGTYAHQKDQAIVTDTWVNTNKCSVEWLDDTTFKVTDLAFTFKMQVEWLRDVVTNMYELADTNGYVTITNVTPASLLGAEYVAPSNMVFRGWVLSPSNDTTFVTELKYGKPETLYAVWDSECWQITYVTNTLPAEAVAAGMTVSHSNETCYTEASTFKFNPAKCSVSPEGKTSRFEGWYFTDGNAKNFVTGISTGILYYASGNSRTNYVSHSHGDLTLIAAWGAFEVIPCTVSFASGIVIDESDDPEYPVYTEVDLFDEEQLEKYKITISEDFPLEGLVFHDTDRTITLPSGLTWNGRAPSGWAVYDPDDLTDPENPPTWTNVFAVGEVELSKFVDSEGNLLDGVTLHAVWTDSGTEKGLSSFEGLYNDEEKPLTGGDTYVGAIMDGDKVIGTITVKCGLPRADGSVNVTATVRIAGECTRTFTGTGTFNGDSIDVMIDKGDDSLALELRSKGLSGTFNGYDINGGVNPFKGSEEDKDAAEEALSPWLGKWMLIFATQTATTVYEGKGDSDVDGGAYAWGYSHILLDIRKKGKVVLSGKLASGREVSATATAIVGDNGICVPAVCSIYSGYDWLRFGTGGLANYAQLSLLSSDAVKNYMKVSNRGGFGFTAWFSEVDGATCVNVNNISDWDSSMYKSMPFVAEVAYTNHQRVADIELPVGEKALTFCVDLGKWGWAGNTEKIGDLSAGSDWIPTNPSNDTGYVQFVRVEEKAAGTNEEETATSTGYKMKALNKAPKMKLVDGMFIVPNKGGSNYANLKLKYDSKNGMFKGSFKVYSIKTDDESGEAKLKKTKIAVSGGVAEGRGYGVGTTSKAGSQPVLLVEPSEADKLLGDDEKADPGDDSEEDFEEEEEMFEE